MKKNIALIAHDNLKSKMVEWAKNHKAILEKHTLFATGTTGKRIETEVGLPLTRFKSGPLGGDQQIGAAICEGRIDIVIFFWDPLEPHSHDVDVKALLRIAAVYNTPMACNLSTADILIKNY
jgi:methylglyoxal synthase